jgi:UTP--glucose-1-phosphate uridylyltransferase
MRMNLNPVCFAVFLWCYVATNLSIVHKFKIFNTNNLWVNLKGACHIYFRPTSSHGIFYAALKRVMDNEGMELEIIINPKVTDDGTQIIQVRLLGGYRQPF